MSYISSVPNIATFHGKIMKKTQNNISHGIAGINTTNEVEIE